MSRFHAGETHEVVIDRLAYQGFGVGRKDGFVFFVSDSCPGDRALVRIDRVKPTCAFASVIDLLSPSPLRKKPDCVYASSCGGCHWQHVSYEEQIQQKTQILKKIFPVADGVTPSPNSLQYRNRIRLHWDGKLLGMFQRKSHSILEISSCAIAHPKISESLPDLKAELNTKYSGKKKHIDIIVENDKAPFWLITDFEDLEYPPFAQVNDGVNLLLHEYVAQKISPESKTIFDLYCGEGNFTHIAAKRAPSANVIGVESNKESITRANERKTLKFVNQPVEKFLRSKPKLSLPLTVLLDPPRSGCGPKTMAALSDLGPDVVIYISCDPMTLKRDINTFIESSKSEYFFDSVTGFDMFPQTYHLETVAVLKKQQ